MEALAIHTGETTEHWEDKTSCIYIVEDKIVTPIVKYIDIIVCFLQGKFDNSIFIPKYDKSSVIPSDMCTKTCSGPIIIRITKYMTVFRFYQTSETEHYRFMRLHEFIVN